MKSLSVKNKNIVIALIVALMTYLGHNFADSHALASALWPAFGFTLAFYYLYGNKVIPGIVIGVFLAQIFNQVFLIHNSVLYVLYFATLFTTVTVFEAILFKFVYNKFVLEHPFWKKNIALSLLSLFTSVLIGGILATLFMSFVFSDFDVLEIAIRWAIGDFSGAILFATLVILSAEKDDYDRDNITKNNAGITFFVGYILFVYLLFGDLIQEFSFQEYSVLLFIFYISSALLFSYRMIICLNIVFLIGFQFLHIPLFGVDDLPAIVLQANTFLILASLSSIVIRYYLTGYSEKNSELINEKGKLLSLSNNIIQFFQIGDILSKKGSTLTSDFFGQMFEIGTHIFSNYDKASCYVREGDNVKFIKAKGYNVSELNAIEFKIESFFWDYKNPIMLRNAEEVTMDRVKNKVNPKYKDNIPILKESIYLSIYVENSITAGMSFDIMKGSSRSFKEDDVRYLRSFQNVINNFYEKQELLTNNATLKNDVVSSLIRTLEVYDKYTSGHSEQVAELAIELGKRMKLDQKELDDLYWAAIVHDIGKIGIPSEILNKPAKLTSEEYREVKKHSEYGYDILSKSEHLKKIAVSVKHHHERWDGLGYPSNLKENEIPIYSQILTLVDSVSCMISHRPYSEPMSVEEVLQELEYTKGKQFSPVPTDIFIEFIKEGNLQKFIR